MLGVVGGPAHTRFMGQLDELTAAQLAELACRNRRVRPGEDFVDAIALPNWDEQSIWGYDTGVRSFFAQLWRNGSRSEDPEVWISGVTEVLPWPGCVALAVVEATVMAPAVVVRALGIAEPAPLLRPATELAAEVERLAGEPPGPDRDGARQALCWVQGRSRVCPGSGWSWVGGPPDAEQVLAEHRMLTGRFYRLDEARRFYCAAGNTLYWALARG